MLRNYFTLDPYSSIEYVNWYVWNQIYETLVTVDAETEKSSCLAKEHTISEDCLNYSFVLRKVLNSIMALNSRFDAVYSLKRHGKPCMSSWTNMMDKAEATGDYSFDSRSSVNTPLCRPCWLSCQLSTRILLENDNQYDIACGTGPYMLQGQGRSTQKSQLC